jgi:hypothetical protein
VSSNRKRLHRRSDDLALLPLLIPTFPRLSSRWNQGCHNVTRLYEEIVAEAIHGYAADASDATRVLCGRKSHGPVSKQTVIWDKPPSPRGVALMMVRPEQRRTREQTAYLEQLIQSNGPVAVVFKLAQDFGRRLAKARGAGAPGAMERPCANQWDCGTDRFCRAR